MCMYVYVALNVNNIIAFCAESKKIKENEDDEAELNIQRTTNVCTYMCECVSLAGNGSHVAFFAIL